MYITCLPKKNTTNTHAHKGHLWTFQPSLALAVETSEHLAGAESMPWRCRCTESLAVGLMSWPHQQGM